MVNINLSIHCLFYASKELSSPRCGTRDDPNVPKLVNGLSDQDPSAISSAPTGKSVVIVLGGLDF